MNNIINERITIFEALENIEKGKYVMPAFQRQYVWSMEQIEKLWDSILLGYPISTFLFWHVDSSNVTNDTYFCSFLKNVTFDCRKVADSVNYDLTGIDFNYTDTAILDGQQRLTSLFLSLYGQANIRQKHARRNSGASIRAELLIELNESRLTNDEEEYNSKKFDIVFSDKIGRISPTQFKVRDILKAEFRNDNTRENAIEEVIKNVPQASKEYARDILNKLYSRIFEEKLVGYTEIKNMGVDDALEMFVRFNSGGKALKKSEITMSILEAYWPSARTVFGNVLVNSYQEFDTDFIIRSALMLYGDVVKSNINKLIADNLKNNWNEFVNTLNKLDELLRKLKIDVNRFSTGWNVLLPIMYYIHYNDRYVDNESAIKSYLMRASLFTYFQSGTTSKLQQMKSYINNYDYEITIDMLEQINDLRVSEAKIEDILNENKGSRVAGEVLYYLGTEWINKNYRYEQDHLHPFARFDSTKPVSITNEDWIRWRGMRNKLPNLHLLEGRTNGSKNDMRLVDYCNDMNDEQKRSFYEEAIIPENVSLEFENFKVFYDERKKLLAEKIKNLLG
ncbi:MAG: DUF262 domain-containing protein [Ignavibacteriales bacterium]